MNITVGKPIVPFSVLDENEEIVSSTNLLGQKYILFFYPKNDSPGCTKEACSVRDQFRDIKKLGYKVFGVSPDKSKKHRKFIDKYEFQYSLLADTEKEMITRFALWGSKQFMGREIFGVYRKTVIVNEEGIVSHIIDKVVTKNHGNQIVEVIKSKAQLASS